jgi:flagellar biosynthesis chaperone FliJ
MSNLKKMRKIEPIVKVRQHSLDSEILNLEKLRAAKLQAVTKMRESQRSYMSSVDQLNQLRSQGLNQEANVFELGIDKLRNRWASLLSEAKQLERQEKMQLKIVMDLEIQLRSVENLRDRFEERFHNELSKLDQSQMDEYSQNRSSTRTR